MNHDICPKLQNLGLVETLSMLKGNVLGKSLMRKYYVFNSTLMENKILKICYMNMLLCFLIV